MRAPGGGGSGSGSGSAGRARAAAFAAVALVLYLLLFSGGDKASSGGNVERSYEPAAAAAPRAADRDVSVGGGPTAAANTATTAAAPPPIRLDGLDGNLERVAGAEVVWQKPPGGRAKGVLLALHGCSHAATDWFPKGPRCAACLGLPEEVNVTGAALARGLAVVALSSADRDSGCWDAFPGSPDAAAARAVAAALLPRKGLGGLPVLALGASSGGAFALALATELPIIAGVVCEIMAMPGLAERAKALSNSGGGKEGAASGGGRKFPPTAFIHMPRDGGTAALVAANAKALAELVRGADAGACGAGWPAVWMAQCFFCLPFIVRCSVPSHAPTHAPIVSLAPAHIQHTMPPGRPHEGRRGRAVEGHRRVARRQGARAARRRQ